MFICKADCFKAGRASSSFGLLLGTEMCVKMKDSDWIYFNNWKKKVVRDVTNFQLINIHKLVHHQQNDNYSNLLGMPFMRVRLIL